MQELQALYDDLCQDLIELRQLKAEVALKLYYEKNKEKIKARAQARQLKEVASPEAYAKYLKYNREWRARNKDRVKGYDAKYRAKQV